MVFATIPNIERAKKLVASGDPSSLRYACLELRFALELVAYEKLRLRLDKITAEEIAAWQPKRVVERLMELVDDSLPKDSVLRMAREDDEGNASADRFTTVGVTKGVDPKKIGSHWQRLGSNLHIRMPRTRSERATETDADSLRAYVLDVIKYIEDLTSSRFDAHFSRSVTFVCDKCRQKLVRNSDLLKHGDVVQCQNQNCPASFIVAVKDGEFLITRYRFHYRCNGCGAENRVEANALFRLKRGQAQPLDCPRCHELACAFWQLQILDGSKFDKIQRNGNDLGIGWRPFEPRLRFTRKAGPKPTPRRALPWTSRARAGSKYARWIAARHKRSRGRSVQ